MDDLNLDNLENLEQEITNKNAVEDRIRNLHKSKKEAEEKAQIEAKARADAEAKIAQMEKETNFLNSFSDVIAKFPTATEYKDKIKEKVMLGYSVDDAAISILHTEGKLTQTVSRDQTVDMGQVIGGSAVNQITQQTTKTVKDMSSSERWDALREAEKRGDIGLQ